MGKTRVGEEINRLMAERPIPVDSVLAAIQNATAVCNPDDLATIEALADISGVMDEIIAVPSLAALPAWGVSGVQALRRILENGFHGDGAQRLLLTIAAGGDLSTVHLFPLPKMWWEECKIRVGKDMEAEANTIIRELMLNQMTDVRLRERLIQNLTFDFMFKDKMEEQPPTVELFLEAFFDTRLVLNRTLIDQFAQLIDSSDREEELHKFVFENPIFLDPLAIEIRSKHELGSEFITDFVLRRINNEYVLVEIEKSTDRIFTKKGLFHSELMEAIGQVRDFQAWIHDNIAYARSKLPGIRRPEGIVVIGRRMGLDSTLQTKLDEENYSRRGHMKILTFDDLLEQARVVYSNMLCQPIRFKGKILAS